MREGSATESGEEARLTVRAKESRLGRRKGIELGFCEFSFRIRSWNGALIVECVESGEDGES